jgi:hypothetical protein
MHTILNDNDTLDSQLEQVLAGAQRSLWRFEQQHIYQVDDESGLFDAFTKGIKLDPNQAPGLRAWFGQVRQQTTERGITIARVRVVDTPPTDYQRWLQFVDRWNRKAGEEILYLPRGAYRNHNYNERSRLWSPFGPAAADVDWWLIDDKMCVLLHIDPAGVRTKVELTTEPMEIAKAIIFRSQAENLARSIARESARRAA